MDRNTLRNARKILGRARAKGKSWTPWVWVDRATAPYWPDGLLRACKNNVYVVQFHQRQTPLGLVDWLMIQTNDGAPIHNWPDFQRIKDELCGEGREAVELYPPKAEVVDHFNVYHLWVLPEGVRIGFGLKV